MTRRKFSGALVGVAADAMMLRGATSRNLKIGHTCITWGTFPRGADAGATLEPAVKDIAALGYWGFETFPEVLEDWDKRDALRPLMDKHNLPLTSEKLRAVIKPAKGEDKWAAIPWQTNLWEARKQAAEKGKPILLWEMDGHPLGCT